MKVLLGVTGCIAAYKSCEIVRRLQKSYVDVEVVMTQNATKFVAPLTFEALTHKPVRTEMFGDSSEPIPHISLAERCDLFLIAPCTANAVAKIAHGIADDLLTSTALAAYDHLAVAPAMNVHMYEAGATQSNLDLLASRGVDVISPEIGYQACGDVGKGRLAEVDAIVEYVLRYVGAKKDLAGKNVMITAGPTIERLDPVRYITNDSSGKMGYALAQAALNRGANVTLISGPVHLKAPDGARVIKIESAIEMYEAANKEFDDADIAIFAAAVADFRPSKQHEDKLKKSSNPDALKSIAFEENPDILATLAARKKQNQFVVGFAAETSNLTENAKRKLSDKNANLIVAIEVGSGKAFGQDEEDAIFITETDATVLPMMTKTELANHILDEALR